MLLTLAAAGATYSHTTLHNGYVYILAVSVGAVGGSAANHVLMRIAVSRDFMPSTAMQTAVVWFARTRIAGSSTRDVTSPPCAAASCPVTISASAPALSAERACLALTTVAITCALKGTAYGIAHERAAKLLDHSCIATKYDHDHTCCN
jgi:hypothetical protein